MADLSNIDILALAQTDTILKRTATTEGGNYAGQCPVCGDRDDFIVLPEHVGVDGVRRGQFFCRECHPKRGDAIDYLEWARKMPKREAIKHLQEQYSLELPANWGNGSKLGSKFVKLAQPIYRIKSLPMNAVAPGEKWQERGKQAIKRAQELLWDEIVGKDARDYLHSRGLTDKIIRSEGLGFVAEDTYDDPLNWGLKPEDTEKVFIPRGILFPYFYKGELWKIRVRRFGGDIPKDKRYMMVSGSSNGLYRADHVQSGVVVAMYEGEIDALSCVQAVGDERVVSVAIGSNSHARIPKWTMLLSRAHLVLRCFDPDNAGADAHAYWSERLKNSKSHKVIDGRHDANEMLTAGDDLVVWIFSGIDTDVKPDMTPKETEEEAPIEQPQPVFRDTDGRELTLQERIALFQSRPCASCGSTDYVMREDGRLVCPCYFVKLEANRQFQKGKVQV